jgi:hypothetical protein
MYVFGNGESRTSVNINQLEGIKIGCNAIYRDYAIDHLVCVDRRMVIEAIDNSINDNALVYTREDWASQFKQFKHIRTVPQLPYKGTERWDEPFQWGSGPYAVLLGAKYTESQQVNLLGFDLHSKNKTVNNIYKDTPNYDTSDKRAVDPRYWIHQIGMVFKCFPKLNFVVYNDDFELPRAWNYPNVTVDKISSLSYNSNN